MLRGRYQLDQPSSGAAGGASLAAVCKKSRRRVRVFQYQQEEADAYERDLASWRRLRSAHVASLVDHWSADGAHFLVVERGRPLAETAAAGALDQAACLRQLCACLTFLGLHGLASGDPAVDVQQFSGAGGRSAWRIANVGALHPMREGELEEEERERGAFDAVLSGDQSLFSISPPFPHTLPQLLLELVTTTCPPIAELESTRELAALLRCQEVSEALAGADDALVLQLLEAVLRVEPGAGDLLQCAAALLLPSHTAPRGSRRPAGPRRLVF